MQTLTKTETCRDHVLQALQVISGPATNETIKYTIGAINNHTYQNNTIAKELSFLIKEGKVQSEVVKGARYCQYQLTSKPVTL